MEPFASHFCLSTAPLWGATQAKWSIPKWWDENEIVVLIKIYTGINFAGIPDGNAAVSAYESLAHWEPERKFSFHVKSPKRLCPFLEIETNIFFCKILLIIRNCRIWYPNCQYLLESGPMNLLLLECDKAHGRSQEPRCSADCASSRIGYDTVASLPRREALPLTPMRQFKVSASKCHRNCEFAHSLALWPRQACHHDRIAARGWGFFARNSQNMY